MCHAHILASDHRPAKKLKLMQEATSRGYGTCPWKGRCATRLAMGHMHVMVNNVKLASSPRHQAFLFRWRDDPEMQPTMARMIQIEHTVKSAWATEMLATFANWDHIPNMIACAYGVYVGNDKLVLKSKLMQ